MNVKSDFTLDDLKKYWNEFAQALKASKRDIEYHVIANREITMGANYVFHISLDNNVQLDQLNTFNVEMMEFLRKKLRNNHLLLKASISEVQTQKIIYTSEDKFKYMSEKYPVLNDLKRRLGLETDF